MLARRYKFNVLVARFLFLPLEHEIHIFSPPCNSLKCLFTLWRKELYSVVFLIATESLLKIVVAAAEMYPILSE